MSWDLCRIDGVGMADCLLLISLNHFSTLLPVFFVLENSGAMLKILKSITKSAKKERDISTCCLALDEDHNIGKKKHALSHPVL